MTKPKRKAVRTNDRTEKAGYRLDSKILDWVEDNFENIEHDEQTGRWGLKEGGFGTPQGAKKSTEKFAANQLKQGLEKVAPKIAPLNARESRLIDAARAISRAVEREANNNQLYGVKSMVAGTLGGAAYASDRDPASAAALALATRGALHPAVASRAAIVASRLAKTAGVSAATAARLAYYAVSESEQEP